MSSTRRVMKTYSPYEDELRQYNEAERIRRGRKKDGYAPSFFADVFDYKQPRRNNRGCGDLTIINTNTGEVKKIPADDVSNVYKHYRARKGGDYSLRTDRLDLAEDK